MFTDVAGFTDLAQSDESAALGMIKELESLAEPVLKAHHGRKVKTMGDGMLVEFPDVLDAVQAAIALQTSLHERNSQPQARPLKLRVGLHIGDVQRKGSDIVGDAVNLASRIEGAAEPGGICLSEQVAVQVRNKLPYRFEPMGPQTLKGIREPVNLFRISLPWASAGLGSAPGGASRIAVLPLANISPDPKDEYFADGLTEELISVLSRVRGLRVIARTSVGQYKSTPKSIRQIGSELGVGAVLEGSVRRSGDRLRITLQLIDVDSEEHRWAETYDRNLNDVFEIQAEVADRTASALRVELVATERDAIRRPTFKSVAAYELYLRGIASFQRAVDEAFVRASVEAAIRWFELAIEKDPTAGAAYAWLGNLLIAAQGESFSSAEVADRIRELVTTAYRLDPQEPEVLTARGNYALQFELDWARAEAEFRSAVAISPSAMSAHAWLGVLLVTLGRYDEAVRELQTAADLDPLFLNVTSWQLRALTLAGRSDDAIRLAESTLSKFPSHRNLHVNLGLILMKVGRRDEARRQAEQTAGAIGGGPLAAFRAELWAQLGEPAEAKELVAQWEAKKLEIYCRPMYIAGLYAVLGEKEKALDLIEWDMEKGERSLWIDIRRTAFDSLRGEPRLRAQLQKIGLPP